MDHALMKGSGDQRLEQMMIYMTYSNRHMMNNRLRWLEQKERMDDNEKINSVCTKKVVFIGYELQ